MSFLTLMWSSNHGYSKVDFTDLIQFEIDFNLPIFYKSNFLKIFQKFEFHSNFEYFMKKISLSLQNNDVRKLINLSLSDFT